MIHTIQINGFDFDIKILNSNWNKEEEMFLDVKWAVVDGHDLKMEDIADGDRSFAYIDACDIVNPSNNEWSDEMEESLQECCKKEALADL